MTEATTAVARDPRREAREVVGDAYDVRLLEPGRPAVHDGKWFADDPAALGDPTPGRPVVTPTSAGDVTWTELAESDDAVAAFAAARWLGARRRLGPIPEGFVEARCDLNQLAFYVMRPARERVNGRIGLRWTLGGFGTPFFGDDEQVRVEGTTLVHQLGDEASSVPLTTFRAAATFLGVPIDPDPGHLDVAPLDDPDRQLRVGEAHVAFLSDWYGFTTSVLEELRLAGRADEDVGRVQLWPEHFDPAVEIGSAEHGRRAGYGGSPGDVAHDEPYLYVGPWAEVDRSDPYWNGVGFGGAELGLTELLAADDQRQTALVFLRRGLQLLRSA